jgi:hypothetical protein
MVFLFLLLAAICFGVAAVGVGVWRLNLVALGLFFWVLTSLIAAWPG